MTTETKVNACANCIREMEFDPEDGMHYICPIKETKPTKNGLNFYTTRYCPKCMEHQALNSIGEPVWTTRPADPDLEYLDDLLPYMTADGLWGFTAEVFDETKAAPTRYHVGPFPNVHSACLYAGLIEQFGTPPAVPNPEVLLANIVSGKGQELRVPTKDEVVASLHYKKLKRENEDLENSLDMETERLNRALQCLKKMASGDIEFSNLVNHIITGEPLKD